MSRPNPKVLLRQAGSYFKQHPDELLRLLRGLFGLRFGVPIDALRYLAREFGGGKKAPKDVVLEAVPPGIRADLTVDAMGTTLRASLVVYIEELEISPETLRVGIRIAGLKLTVLGESSTPLAALIQSGALDLSKPGNLVAFMPKRPAALVDAKDDRITLDLIKIPKIGDNPKTLRLLRILTPVLNVQAIRTDDDHLDLHLKANPSGISDSIAAAKSGY